MKKSTIIYSLVTVIVIIALYFVGGSSTRNGSADTGGQNADNTSESFASAEKTFDFGTISMANGKVSHSFEFENIGSAPVTIGRIYTSCMCTSATLIKSDKSVGPFGMQGHGFAAGISESLAPGEKAKMEVIFDPAAHGPAGIGPIQRVVRAETNSGYLEFEIKSNVTP
ncbi:MAG: DUF1573 domain-containing protein [Candidatus Liptonbacteria bacterium]|nr:DUF1573 domain-containing protein [Candidatus Liptonbacteria bacterium]